MEVLGARLGEPVGQRSKQNRAVVIVASLESGHLCIDTETCGHGKGADVVRNARIAGGDEVREAIIRLTLRLRALLA